MAGGGFVKIPGTGLVKRAVRKLVQNLLSEDELLDSFWSQYGSGLSGPSRNELRSNTGWVYGANRQIAGRASRVGTNLFLVSHNVAGSTIEKQVFNHPILDIIRTPNPDEYGLLFHWRQILQLQTVGVSYVIVFPSSFEVRNTKDPRAHPVVVARIDQMRLLEPDRVSVFPDEGRMAGRFTYRLLSGDDKDFRPAPVSPAEMDAWRENPYPYVFRIQMPDAGSYNPGGPTRAVTTALNNLDALGRLHWNQLKNGVHAGLIFSILSESENPERFRVAVEMLKIGIGQAGEPMVLPKNRIEVSDSPANNQEMQFSQLATKSRHEALAAMGGSDALIGMSDQISRSNLWTMEWMLATGTVDPMNDLISHAYNAYLAPLYPRPDEDAVWRIIHGSSAKLDKKDQVDIDVLMVNAGLRTPNELRERDNIESHQDGDKLKGFTLGVAGLSDPEIQDAQDNELGGDTLGTGLGESDVDRERLLWAPDSRAEMWEELSRTSLPMERTFETALSAAYKDMGEAVLAAVDEQGMKVLRDREPDWQERIRNIGDWWNEGHWKDVFRTLHSSSSAPWVESGFGLVVSETGIDPEVMGLGEREAAVFTTSRAFEFSEEVTKTTKDRLTQIRDDAVADGGTFQDFRKALVSQFASFRKDRATRGAVTEVNAALNWATSLGIRIVSRFGFKIRKMWLSSRDALVRDTHSIADGQMRNASELFDVGGCQMMQPLDGSRCGDAAEIVWCRCRVWPVILR